MRSFDLRIAIESIRKLDMSFGWGNITNRAVHLGGILKIPLQHQVCTNSCQTVQTIQHDSCGETSSQILGVQKKQQPTSDGKSARHGRQRPNKKMQWLWLLQVSVLQEMRETAASNWLFSQIV